MSNNVTVRNAIAADIPLISAWLNDPSNPLWRAGDLARALTAPGYRLVVACAESPRLSADVANTASAAVTPLGFALLRVIEGYWSLLYLLVNPAVRRSGVARALLHSLQADIENEAGECLVLEVRVGNSAARALYLDCGFVEEGRRPRYYEALQQGGEREDALLLTWRNRQYNSK